MPVTPGALRLRTLGPPTLTDEAGKSPPSLGWGKPLALLCFLAVRREARRDEIVDLLWRGMESARARNTFRQALHRLRTALGEDLLPPDREFVRLVRSPRLNIDLWLFDQAVAGERIDEAIELYTGDFLDRTELGETPFDHWADQERTRIRTQFRQVLRDGVLRASASGRWPDAVGRAKRLLALAPFDAPAAELTATTLVSAGRALEARELLKGFADRLDAELGLPMPPEVSALYARLQRHHEPASDNATVGHASEPVAFAGREAELAQLMSLWRGTREDAGALALIEGDAGIGKSRLLREFVGHAKALGRPLVLLGRERPHGAQLPLGVFAEALRPLVRAPGAAGASRHLLAEAARLLPELRDNFELPEAKDVDDEAARLRFFEGLAALIDAVAYEQPVMLLLEEVHGLAPASLDLLSYLTARLAGSAVMFGLTLRPDSATPTTLARLRSLAVVTDAGSPPHGEGARQLTLGPLTHAESHAAIAAAMRRAGVAEQIAERVALRAEGVPSRLAELARRAVAGDEIAAAPVSVRVLIGERLQRFSAAQRRLLLVLAMIGRPVTRGAAASAAHISSDAADESVRALAADGLVELLGDEVAATPLAADVILETAEAPTRAFLGGWIADAFARDRSFSHAELARFFGMAGDPRRTFESARGAAFDALALGAVAEAVQYLHTARAFAWAPEQHEEIESLLTALGSGRLRLPAKPDVAGDTRQAASAPSSGITTPTSAWERLFPNWRYLLGAAVATLIVSVVALAPRAAAPRTPRPPSTDTLVVSEGDDNRALRFVTGDLSSGFSLSSRVAQIRSDPPWIDSLDRSWTNAVAAPNGGHVAVSRLGTTGADLYVIGAARRDTIPLVIGRGDVRALGWSPDSRWLLARTSRRPADGSFDTDLTAHEISGDFTVRAIDTTLGRAVTEAAWSPDGSRIAWVARVGTERQLEVFTSLSDGSSPTNVSRHPADDYRIAWSGDGELLAFTSLRDGNAELYAFGVREGRLWRLTRDPAQDDRASFSRNGRLIAFESTRGGVAGVYVMPSLGGAPRRVAETPSLEVVTWLGGAQRYLDRVRVQAGALPHAGDSITLMLRALDQFGDSIAVHGVSWKMLDSSFASIAPSAGDVTQQRRLVARRAGLAHVIASVGRWRVDTAPVRIGTGAILLLPAWSTTSLSRDWQSLGVPAPRAVGVGGSMAVAIAADREWDSGILSRAALPLLPGLTLSAVLDAPFRSANDQDMSANVALVAPEDSANVDAAAPQFLRYASFTWNADPGQFVYAVGREVFAEPLGADVGASAEVQIVVEQDSTVRFLVQGKTRWRSVLRIIDPRRDATVHAWIGGRATGDSVRVSGVAALLAALLAAEVTDPIERR